MASPWGPSVDFLCRALSKLGITSASPMLETIQQRLDKLRDGRPNDDPDFNRQLMLVLNNKLLGTDEETRVQSGQTLESNIRAHFHQFRIQLIDFMKSECIAALDDPSPVIRASAFALIKAILVKIEKFSNWPDVLPKLCQMLLDSTDDSDQEGACHALHLAREDLPPEIKSIEELHKELIHKFLQFLNHINPQIRATGCTTLGSFVELNVVKPFDEYFKPLIKVILQCVLDEHELVQSAACWALSTIQTLVSALAMYQRKNLPLLYDVIATLAKSVGNELMNEPQYINLLLPPLVINRASLKPDDGGDLVKRLECLHWIVRSLREGFGFAPLGEAVFRSCIWIIDWHYERLDANEPPPDNGLLVAAIKLISGLVEEPCQSTKEFIRPSEMMTLLCKCLKDPSPEVREASFSLLKSLCSICYHQLRLFLDYLIPMFEENLNPDSPSVCQAAISAFGVIADSQMKNEGMSEYIQMLLPRLISIINRSDIKRDLLEDTVVLLGHLVFSCPRDVAPRLFTYEWRSLLMPIKKDVKLKVFFMWCDLITSTDLDNAFSTSHVLLLYRCFLVQPFRRAQTEDFLGIVLRNVETLGHFAEHSGKWIDFVAKIPSQTLDRMMRLYGGLFFPEIPKDS